MISNAMEQRCEDLLNDDCWELVLNRMEEDYRDISSVSSVCKTFLSITNKITIDLRINHKYLSNTQFARLLQRFTKLKSIDIRRDPFELVDPVSQILQSNLELESLSIFFQETPATNCLQGSGLRMRTLKKLIVTNPLCDDDLISLVDSFPCVEKLKIYGLYYSSCPFDSGMEVSASKLKGLVEISLVFCRRITDQSLIFFSSKCSNLTKIFINQCTLTELGIGYIMRHCSKLTTLSVIGCLNSSLSNGEQSFNLENSFPNAKNLEDIRIYDMDVSKVLLRSIANSCHRLKKVKLKPQKSFTLHGLKMFLEVCSSLEYFKPGVPWLTDKSIVDISPHLNSLTHTNLEGRAKLSSATFYLLTKRCHRLKKIVTNHTSVGRNEDPNLDLHQKFTMNSISIDSCIFMSDSALKRFCFVCLNLVTPFASECPLLTYNGWSEIYRISPQIRAGS